MIPVAYYLKTIGLPNNFDSSTSRVNDIRNIKLWFVSSLLKRVFSFSADGILKPVREIIKNQSVNGFPINEIFDYFKGTNRSLQFSNDDIYSLLYTKYGQGDILVILSILYPWADLRQNFHIDHMYPKSAFTYKKLKENGVPDIKYEEFIKNSNYIGNLQLLESIPNIQKNAMELKDWLNQIGSVAEQEDYKKKHYIPNVNLDFVNFDVFIEEREKLLIQKLSSELRK
jgi:hypothetical protein